MDNDQLSIKKPWLKRHPILGVLLGFFTFGLVASAFDSLTTEQNLPSPIPSSSIIREVLSRTPTPTYKSPQQQCHPSYSGCLNPNASDYDCAGGSGNGPYYTGRVRVIGPDVFGLDRDRDGWGCE